MSEYTNQVYKNVPFSYKLRKSHYYDIIGQNKVSADTSLSETFSAYSGLNMTYSQTGNSIPHIVITGGELPDYSVVASTDGCMGATGYNYINFEQGYSNFNMVGHPTLNQITGEYIGGGNNYIETKETLNFSTAWECIVKFKTGSNISSEAAVINTGTDQTGFRFGYKSSKFMLLVGNGSWFSTSTSDYLGSHTISANTIYTVKFGWTGSQYYMSFLDNDSWVSDRTYSKSTAISSFVPRFVCTSNVYLADTSLKINGVEKFDFLGNVAIERAGLLATTDDGSAQTWNLFYNNGFVLDTASTKSGYDWCGSLSVSSHTVYHAYKKGDLSVTGTLYSDSYRLMGFNASNYISTNYTFSMTTEQFNQGFTMQVHFVTPSSFPNNYQRLLSCGSTYQYGPYLAIKPNGAGFSCGLATGGSVILNIADTGQLLTNTEYWIRLTKPNTQYFAHDTVLELSTDGTNWTTVATNSGTITSNVTGNQTLKLGVAPDSSDQYFFGLIDLRDTFIEIAGTKVWQALIE